MTAPPASAAPRVTRERRGPAWLAPTPPSVAIEIASRRVTVVEVARSAAGPVVAACATEALPADAVTPALSGANIPNLRVVADALRRAFERAGLGSPRRAALVVPDSIARVSLLHFEQVPARPADLDQLIKWQLRKSTPFPIDEAKVEHMPANAQDGGTTFAAVVARRDVLAQYEAVAADAGVHAGIVDLASFNVINAVIGAGAAPADDPSALREPQGRPEHSRGAAGSGSARASSRADWLVICLAQEATTIAILRGQELLFYRHRAAIDEEPLSALVHQTAMYHEDRLGGSAFARVWLCGSALGERGAERAREEIRVRLGVAAEPVDIRAAATLRDRITAGPEVLDALAAPVGVLIRERPERAG